MFRTIPSAFFRATETGRPLKHSTIFFLVDSSDRRVRRRPRTQLLIVRSGDHNPSPSLGADFHGKFLSTESLAFSVVREIGLSESHVGIYEWSLRGTHEGEGSFQEFKFFPLLCFYNLFCEGVSISNTMTVARWMLETLIVKDALSEISYFIVETIQFTRTLYSSITATFHTRRKENFRDCQIQYAEKREDTQGTALFLSSLFP